MSFPDDRLNSDPSLVQEMQEQAIAHASLHGASMMVDLERKQFLHIPTTLIPSQLSAKTYERVIQIAPALNHMIHAVSHEYEWLNEQLTPVAKLDDFVANLLKIMNQVLEEGFVQSKRLGMFRSDYMLHIPRGQTDYVPKQVELNTVAASFGCLSSRLTDMHRFLIQRYLPGSEAYSTENLPENPASREFARALGTGHRAWLQEDGKDFVAAAGHTPAVLFIVQEGERNIGDQKWLEYELWEQSRIPVIRRTLTEIHQQGRNVEDGTTRHFVIQDRYVVSVFYFRSAYVPTDFRRPEDWEALLQVERSSGIKCPSVPYHLAGSKKIQQALCGAGVLEKFLVRSQEAEAREKEVALVESIRDLFGGLWGFDDPEDPGVLEALEDAIRNPSDYVLKPQREGGGNNFWGPDMVEILKRKDFAEELSAFILMERFHPPVQPSILMQHGKLKTNPAAAAAAADGGQGDGPVQPYIVNTTQELGIYSWILADSEFPAFAEVKERSEVLSRSTPVGEEAKEDSADHEKRNSGSAAVLPYHNVQGGHLVRTKLQGVEEGGIASGFAVLDTPILVQD